MNLPPEVYGALAVAQRHLKTAGCVKYTYPHRGRAEKKARHLAKVQKLVRKAACLLAGRQLSFEQAIQPPEDRT